MPDPPGEKGQLNRNAISALFDGGKAPDQVVGRLASDPGQFGHLLYLQSFLLADAERDGDVLKRFGLGCAGRGSCFPMLLEGGSHSSAELLRCRERAHLAVDLDAQVIDDLRCLAACEAPDLAMRESEFVGALAQVIDRSIFDRGDEIADVSDLLVGDTVGVHVSNDRHRDEPCQAVDTTDGMSP